MRIREDTHHCRVVGVRFLRIDDRHFVLSAVAQPVQEEQPGPPRSHACMSKQSLVMFS